MVRNMTTLLNYQKMNVKCINEHLGYDDIWLMTVLKTMNFHQHGNSNFSSSRSPRKPAPPPLVSLFLEDVNISSPE